MLFDWLDRVGFNVHIAALRRDYPEVRWHTFADWAGSQNWELVNPTPRIQVPGG